MSNDLRFFLVRLGLFAMIVMEAMLLFSVVSKAQSPPEYRGDFFALEIVAIFLLIVATIPLAVYYYSLKSKRWENSTEKTQDQIDVETLAAYSHSTIDSSKKE